MAKKFFEPKISVIIPMYNAEKYVGECLESLLNQTLQNFEVIVVDDCSKDNSVSVVKKFLPKFDGRLKILSTKKNSGTPGIPRNVGLKSARGKYIYFLDSDDFFDETALEDFFKVAEDFDADVVQVEKFFHYESTDSGWKDKIFSFQRGNFVTEPELEIFDIEKRISDFFNFRYMWGANKLLRRKFLIDNNIGFPEMRSYEDYIFAFQCVVAAKNYVRVPFVNYHYRILDNSTSRNIDFMVGLKSTIAAVSYLDQFMSNQKFFIENPSQKFKVTVSYLDWATKPLPKIFFIQLDIPLDRMYNYFYEEIFSKNFGKNSALITYLFFTLNLYKLNSEQQENKIAELQNQLAKFQS